MSTPLERQAALVSLPDDPTANVLYEVFEERSRQDAKFGDQSHNPDGTNPDFATEASWFRLACEDATSIGRVTWSHILLEETYEALAEVDPAKLRAELIQVAAVAVAWVEALDRR